MPPLGGSMPRGLRVRVLVKGNKTDGKVSVGKGGVAI